MGNVDYVQGNREDRFILIYRTTGVVYVSENAMSSKK